MIYDLPRQVLALLGVLLFCFLSGPPKQEATIFDYPVAVRENLSRPTDSVPTPKVRVSAVNGWIRDPEISWYGSAFYGNGTACGQTFGPNLHGVAHRSLPCGTLVEFRYKGRSIEVPVIDRGPFVDDRIWDLARATCKYLQHCFTGPIEYRIVQ